MFGLFKRNKTDRDRLVKWRRFNGREWNVEIHLADGSVLRNDGAWRYYPSGDPLDSLSKRWDRLERYERLIKWGQLDDLRERPSE